MPVRQQRGKDDARRAQLLQRGALPARVARQVKFTSIVTGCALARQVSPDTLAAHFCNGRPSSIVKALSFHQLTKTYKNGVQALKGIDLTVEEGDFFALLGPNGAGKTTAIGIVTSLVNKSSGKVEVFGHAADVRLAAGCAIQSHVADDDVLVRHERRAGRRRDDQLAARQAFADVVVGVAFEEECHDKI